MATNPNLPQYGAPASPDAQKGLTVGFAHHLLFASRSVSLPGLVASAQSSPLETQNVQADRKGNSTVQLGSTKVDGLPLELFSSGQARWLGTSVNGGAGQPRPSVPNALKAAGA